MLSRRIRLAGLASGLVLAAASASSVARAEQFVVLDETWTHSPDLPDSHFRVEPSGSTPADWVSPIDYSQGTAHVYLEVHTKPTAQETRFQVCFEATPTYACTDQSPTYTTIGTYEWATPFANFWSPEGTSVDWTQGVNLLACILKDTENNKPSADNVGDEIAALYMPTDVRMVVTIVTPGGTYEPPTPTGEGGGGGGGEGGSGGAGSSTTASSSVASSTSASSGGTSTSSASTSTSGGGPSTGSGVTAGAGGGDATSEEAEGDGCSIGASPRGALWAAPTLLLAALLRLRRRARSG